VPRTPSLPLFYHISYYNTVSLLRATVLLTLQRIANVWAVLHLHANMVAALLWKRALSFAATLRSSRLHRDFEQDGFRVNETNAVATSLPACEKQFPSTLTYRLSDAFPACTTMTRMNTIFVLRFQLLRRRVKSYVKSNVSEKFDASIFRVVQKRLEKSSWITLVMETASSSETPVSIYQDTRRHTPEKNKNFINASVRISYLALFMFLQPLPSASHLTFHTRLRRIYTCSLWMCIEYDSSSVKVNDESLSVYTFQWLNSFH
jgi:hypothetical protein